MSAGVQITQDKRLRRRFSDHAKALNVFGVERVNSQVPLVRIGGEQTVHKVSRG